MGHEMTENLATREGFVLSKAAQNQWEPPQRPKTHAPDEQNHPKTSPMTVLKPTFYDESYGEHVSFLDLPTSKTLFRATAFAQTTAMKT